MLSKEVALGFCVSHRGSETYGLPDVYWVKVKSEPQHRGSKGPFREAKNTEFMRAALRAH